MCSSISSLTRSSSSPRSSATRLAWMRALATEICGSTPDAEVVTASTGMSPTRAPACTGPRLQVAVGERTEELRELLVVRTEVVEEGDIARKAGDRGPRLEVVRVGSSPLEPLPDQLRPDRLPVPLDEAAVRLVPEDELGDAVVTRG